MKKWRLATKEEIERKGWTLDNGLWSKPLIVGCIQESDPASVLRDDRVEIFLHSNTKVWLDFFVEVTEYSQVGLKPQCQCDRFQLTWHGHSPGCPERHT